MGISLTMWRQRIGSYHPRRPPKSKASRMARQAEVIFSSSNWRLDKGGSTFIIVLLAASIGYMVLQTQLPHRCDILKVCGDVEMNPGPSAALSNDLLQSLSSGNHSAVQPLKDGLKNKHIIQLFAHKEKEKCSWDAAVTWLRLLMTDFPATDLPTVNWQRNIGDSWRNLKKVKRRLQSNKNKSKEKLEDFETWEEETYKLPSVRGPNKPQTDSDTPTVSKFDMDCVKAQNEKLLEENRKVKEEIQRLQQQVQVLQMRQSPHSQVNQDRREMRKNVQIKDLQNSSKAKEKEIDKLETKVDGLKSLKRKLSYDCTASQSKLARVKEEKLQEHNDYVFSLENDKVDLANNVQSLEEELKKLREVNAILLDATIYWRSKLAAAEHKELKLLENGSFTSNLRKCVYELLGCHVAQDKVPKVIESVMELAKIKIDRLPSSSAVRNMNKEMLVVAQAHLQDLVNAGSISLQSDETPKYGECYEAFVANDDSANSYILGMRHMADKSAQTTFNTLQEILEDITDTCKTISDEDNTGYKIMKESHQL